MQKKISQITEEKEKIERNDKRGNDLLEKLRLFSVTADHLLLSYPQFGMG